MIGSEPIERRGAGPGKLAGGDAVRGASRDTCETLGIHPEGMGIVRKQVARDGLKDRKTAAGKQGCACQREGRPAVSEETPPGDCGDHRTSS